jgi:small subunit ribosomal protein S16
MGAKKKPFYRLVVCDSAGRRDGKPIEEIGYYDPTREPRQVKIDEARALHWLREGARPSDTVRSLFRQAGVMQKFRGTNKDLPESASQSPDLLAKDGSQDFGRDE